jgi:hypothetical protein
MCKIIRFDRHNHVNYYHYYWPKNAAVMEYQQGSNMCETIQLTGINIFMIVIMIIIVKYRARQQPTWETHAEQCPYRDPKAAFRQ